ncbi:MAG: AraC family transcriptional regulator [Bacteroidetes bacterium]|jgi:AraC family transcriptional regulator|nr:AraC family transcriptional regulator [Bacteroidota bacterium]
MEPIIKNIPEKKLIGKRLRMSIANNKTFDLWKSFMPFRNEIKSRVNTEMFSMQVFDPSFSFLPFDIHAEFDKWAAVEVSESVAIPEGMEAFTLPGGLYAVFLHKGPASGAERTFRYIFETWLPASGYILDTRPHFELLGEKYKNNDPDSEEEVWIPIRK